MIFRTPSPGMLTRVSRRIDSFRTEPKPTCMTRMLSERGGPAFAPGSLLPKPFLGRSSEPSTSTFVPVSTLPPPDSAAFVFESTPPFTCALRKNVTIDIRIQASAASATHLSTRRGVMPPFSSSGDLTRPRRRLIASIGFAPAGASLSRRRLRDL